MRQVPVSSRQAPAACSVQAPAAFSVQAPACFPLQAPACLLLQAPAYHSLQDAADLVSEEEKNEEPPSSPVRATVRE